MIDIVGYVEETIIVLGYILFLTSIIEFIINIKKRNIKKAFLWSNGIPISCLIIIGRAYIFYSTHIYDVEEVYPPTTATPFLYIVVECSLFYSMFIISIGVISSIVSTIKNVKRINVCRTLFSSISILYFTMIILFHFLNIVYLNYLDNDNLIVIILSYYFMVLNILLCFDNKEKTK